jgi:restriction system protein
MPTAYKSLGPLAGIPFLVVCVMVVKKQWNAPKPAALQATLEHALTLAWPAFAQQLQTRWESEGYEVSKINTPHADLRIERGAHCALIAARRYKAANHGIQPLRDLHAAMQKHQATEGIYVAAQGDVSDTAMAFAQEHHIKILHSNGLALWLLQKSVTAP